MFFGLTNSRNVTNTIQMRLQIFLSAQGSIISHFYHAQRDQPQKIITCDNFGWVERIKN